MVQGIYNKILMGDLDEQGRPKLLECLICHEKFTYSAFALHRKRCKSNRKKKRFEVQKP